MSTFLILGGTGKVGRRLAISLSAAGHEPRPASRQAAVRFDWADHSTWAAALAGADGLFIVGPGSATDWSPSLAGLLAAAGPAGVKHAVLLSARGVEFLPDGAVALAEQALRHGPLPWTILRPAHFSQNFTEAMFAPSDGLILAPVGTGREPFIDVRDIADVAAAVLASGGYDGATVDLSGPEAVSFPPSGLGNAGGLHRVADGDARRHQARRGRLPQRRGPAGPGPPAGRLSRVGPARGTVIGLGAGRQRRPRVACGRERDRLAARR